MSSTYSCEHWYNRVEQHRVDVKVADIIQRGSRYSRPEAVLKLHFLLLTVSSAGPSLTRVRTQKVLNVHKSSNQVIAGMMTHSSLELTHSLMDNCSLKPPW
ncbi:hypothetical protein J6590_032636 [Homalodisca vitripennis]|nr:hypothetical protein J6590_032636 [Homalodisca vitripennis]